MSIGEDFAASLKASQDGDAVKQARAARVQYLGGLSLAGLESEEAKERAGNSFDEPTQQLFHALKANKTAEEVTALQALQQPEAILTDYVRGLKTGRFSEKFQPVVEQLWTDAYRTLNARDWDEKAMALAKGAAEGVVEGAKGLARGVGAAGAVLSDMTPESVALGAGAAELGIAQSTRLLKGIARGAEEEVTAEGLKKIFARDLKELSDIEEVRRYNGKFLNEMATKAPGLRSAVDNIKLNLTDDELASLDDLSNVFDPTNLLPIEFVVARVGQGFGLAAKSGGKSAILARTMKTAAEAAAEAERLNGTLRKVRKSVGEAMQRGGQKLAGSAGGAPVATFFGALASGADPITATAASAIVSNLPRGTRTLTGKALETAGKVVAADLPLPLERVRRGLANTGKQMVEGAAQGMAANSVFALGAQTPEQAGQQLGVGLGLGGIVEPVGGLLDVTRNRFDPRDRTPEMARQPLSKYNEGVDDIHEAAVSKLDNASANAVEQLRQTVVGDDGRLYVVDNPEQAAKIYSKYTGVDVAPGTLKSNGFMLPANKTVNGKGVAVIFSRGEGLGHEPGHLLMDALRLSKDEKLRASVDELFAAARRVLPEKSAEFAEVQNYYNGLLREGQEKLMTPEQVYEEFIAEHFTTVVGGAPAIKFGGSMPLSKKIYDIALTLGEKVGAYQSGLDLTGQSPVSSTAIPVKPSPQLAKLVENMLAARQLELSKNVPSDLVRAEAAPAEPPVLAPTQPAQGLSNVEQVIPAPQPPGFKKGDPIGAVKDPQGTLVLSGAKVWADAQGNTVRVEGVDVNGNLVRADVPREWLQSVQGQPERKLDVGTATPVPESLTQASGEVTPGAITGQPTPTPTPTPTPKAAPVANVTEQKRQTVGGVATPELQAKNSEVLKQNLHKPVEVEYLSATGSEESADAAVRLRERQLADRNEQEGVPNPYRSIYGKVVVPTSIFKSGSGKDMIFGFSPDKLIRNIDQLRGWYLEKGDKASADRLYSQEFQGKVRTYLENQANGYRGDGERIVRPAGTDPSLFPVENPKYTPVKLGEADRNLINFVMGLDPVSMNPTSIAGAWVMKLAELNGFKVASTVPGKRADKAYFNPLVEQMRKAGFDGKLNSVIEQLRVERMVGDAVPRPDLASVKPAIQGSVQAGFMPEALDVAVRQAEAEMPAAVAAGVTTGVTRPLGEEGKYGNLPQLGVDPISHYVLEDGGLIPHRFMPTPPGFEVSPPRQSYGDGVREEKTKNLWVRQSGAADNKGRVLVVQIEPNLMYPDGPDPVSTPYYDKLYSGVREGYVRSPDFWELPQWQAVVTKNLGERVDGYYVSDIEEAKRFFAAANYDHVAFSVMDVSAKLTEQMVPAIAGTVHLGGYTDRSAIARAAKDARIYDNMSSFVQSFGVPYTNGFDYRLFRGTSTIPRLEMSAGCRHRCTFCTIERKVTEQPFGSIVEQADSFKELNAKLVYLNDKTFGQAEISKRLPEVYEQMKEANPDFQGFIVQTTAAQMKLFTDDFLQKSGIRYVELGVETYNDAILKTLRKPATEKLIDDAVAKLRRNGVNFIPNIVIGFPGETAETYAHTRAWLEQNRDVISHVNTYNLAVYAGTEMAKTVETKTAADADENSPTKSFYKDPAIHENFAKWIYQYGMQLLDEKKLMPEAQSEQPERIVNIGLHVGGKPALTAEKILHVLRGEGFTPEYEVRQSSTEPTFIAKVRADDNALDRMARLLGQDAIAVYNPSDDTGKLIGPGAAKWGDFNKEYFLPLSEQKDEPAYMPAPPVDSPEFKEWFGDSKVVDSEGQPKRVYHSTVAGDVLTRFKRRPGDVGMHFGTEGQAEDRFNLKLEKDPYGPDLRGVMHATVPVYLSIKNPLRLPDLGRWNPDNMVWKLRELFPNDPAIGTGWGTDKLTSSAKVREFLQSKGYDGIVYKNTGEVAGAEDFRKAIDEARAEVNAAFGKSKSSFSPEEQKHPAYQKLRKLEEDYRQYREQFGEDSWIAFAPTQIKSAIGNKGTFDPTNPDIRYMPEVVREKLTAEQEGDVLDAANLIEQMKHGGEQNVVYKSIKAVPDDVLEKAVEWAGLNLDWTPPSPEEMDVAKALPLAEPPKAGLQIKGKRLPGSVPEKTLDLVHYSTRGGLDVTDPTQMGSGKATARDMRGLPGTFFFVKGSPLNADQHLVARGSTAYSSKVSGARVYDSRAGADRLGFWKEPNREKADQKLIDAGYAGWRVVTPDGRDVVKLFEPVRLRERGPAKDSATASFMPAPPVDSPEFERWSGGKKVYRAEEIDTEKPPRSGVFEVYHGTKEDITEFKSKFPDGLIFTTTNPEFAAQWGRNRNLDGRSPRNYPKEVEMQDRARAEAARPLDDASMADWEKYFDTREYREPRSAKEQADTNVMKLYANVEKAFDPRTDYRVVEPLLKTLPGYEGIVDKGSHKVGNWIVYENKAVVDLLKSKGYDAMWLTESSVDPKHETLAVFSNTQLKSATGNRGTFDPSNPDIRFQPKPTEAQNTEFKGSKVRDEDGNLKPYFHFTKADFPRFGKGDLGYHFGTAEQAASRAEFQLGPGYETNFGYDWEVRAKHRSGGRTIPVYLNIENPLRMRDVGPWDDPEEVLFALPPRVLAEFPRSVGEAVDHYKAQLADYDGRSKSYEEFVIEEKRKALAAIREGLKAQGYDGVVYRNAFESKEQDADSYIAFDNDQIMPAFTKDVSARWMPGEAGTFKVSEDMKFMPVPRVKLDDYIGRDVITLTSDRLDIGQKEVGPVGGRKLMARAAQGGRGFPILHEGYGWAFSDKASAGRFITRLKATAEGDTALVATSVLGERNVLNSPFGQHAVALAYRHAVEAGALKEKQVDASIRTIFSRAAEAAQGNPDMKKIKTLADYERATENWPFSFGETKEIVKRLDAAELKLPAELRAALGMDSLTLARSISDPELHGLPMFSLVSLMEIPIDQTPENTDIHHSYPWTVKGKLLGFFESPYAAEPLIKSPRVRVRGNLSAQPMMTVMPSLDALKPSEINVNPEGVLRDARISASLPLAGP